MPEAVDVTAWQTEWQCFRDRRWRGSIWSGWITDRGRYL